MSPRRSNAAERLSLPDPELDPVWAAILRAPVAKEAETEEERRLVEEALRGPFISSDVVSQEIEERCRLGD